MASYVVWLCCACLVNIIPVIGFEQLVLLEFGQNVPETSACSFPESLDVHMKSYLPFQGSLALKRKDEINTDAPAYELSSDENGVVRFIQLVKPSREKTTAAYQDPEYGAAFLVHCKDGLFQAEGTLYLEGRKYRVKAAPENSQVPEYRGQHVPHIFTPVTDTNHYDEPLQVGSNSKVHRSLTATTAHPDA